MMPLCGDFREHYPIESVLSFHAKVSRGKPMHVDSTAIRDIDYDEDRRKLFVRFTSGAEYVYVGVPSPVHRAFAEAPSKGGYFAKEIRDSYPFSRLSS